MTPMCAIMCGDSDRESSIVKIRQLLATDGSVVLSQGQMSVRVDES